MNDERVKELLEEIRARFNALEEMILEDEEEDDEDEDDENEDED